MIAEAIRDILLETGGTWPLDIYRRLGEYPFSWKRSRLTVYKLVSALKTIGLIELAGVTKGTNLLERHIYRVKPGMESDPRWSKYPLHELYPSNYFGAMEYRKRKKEGLIKTGRAERYAKD